MCDSFKVENVKDEKVRLETTQFEKGPTFELLWLGSEQVEKSFLPNFDFSNCQIDQVRTLVQDWQIYRLWKAILGVEFRAKSSTRLLGTLHDAWL